MVKFIDKDGNIQEFTWTVIQEDMFKEWLEYINGVYFEPKELTEVKLKEEESKEEIKEEVSELELYKGKLKDAKVKGRQLISDVERAKAKCEELWL